MTKEEYFKRREENFAFISDDEEEEKEMKRLNSKLKDSKTNLHKERAGLVKNI